MATLNDGRTSVDVITNKTLTAADQGIVQNVIVDGLTITLPSTAAGLNFIVRNGGAPSAGTPAGSAADGSLGLTVAPAAADAVAGNGFTAAVNKGAVNTKATAKVGDELHLLASGTAGVSAWNVKYNKGTWTRVP